MWEHFLTSRQMPFPHGTRGPRQPLANIPSVCTQQQALWISGPVLWNLQASLFFGKALTVEVPAWTIQLVPKCGHTYPCVRARRRQGEILPYDLACKPAVIESQDKKHQQLPEPEAGSNGVSPGASRVNTALLTVRLSSDIWHHELWQTEFLSF